MVRRVFTRIVCFIVIASLIGCGTILYPERKGQKVGRLDSGIVILNGVGLLLFFVPGVIAFATDFVTGTIYLPDESSDINDPSAVKAIAVDGPMTPENIAAALERELGESVNIQQAYHYALPATAAQAEHYRHLAANAQ